MLTEVEFKTIVESCRNLAPPQGNYRDSDYLITLMNTVLDKQMRRSVLGNSIDHFQQYQSLKIRNHEDLAAFFDRFPDMSFGNREAAHALWGYNYGNRLQQLRRLHAFLTSVGVTDQESLRSWVRQADYQNDFKGKVPGLALGVYQWLKMRLGVDTVKPDIHVKRWLTKIIGRAFTDTEAIAVFERAASVIGRPAHLIDWAIWEKAQAEN